MMKKFLINIALFFIVLLTIGEIVVRTTYSVSDIPQRTIDEHGIQKYIPNQKGWWKGGEHKWMINKYGWPGELPENFDDLILIIGDSFIENFMNPNECHQAAFLKEKMINFNFMEIGRSGVSFIEAMEISKHLDSLKPVKSLIYVNNNDFYESVVDIKPINDITQLNLKSNVVVHGKMKTPGIKKVLYTWKLLYYLYNRFPLNLNVKTPTNLDTSKDEDDQLKHITEVSNLINYIASNYEIDNKTLVFHPNCSKTLIKMCKNVGFNVIELDSSKDKSWTFEYDSHWTCFGHEQVANQISRALLNDVNLKKYLE